MADQGSWGSAQKSSRGFESPNSEMFTLSQRCQSLSADVQKISKICNDIDKMVTQIGTPQDSEQLRGRLHEIQHSTNELAKRTGAEIKSLASEASAGLSPNEQRTFKLQRDRLVNDFSVVLKNFQMAQRLAAKKEKDSVLRAKANSSTVNENPFDDDTKSDVAVSSVRLQIEQNVDTQALKEREQAIHQLEADIVDVNQIFKDLAVMVHEQGDMVDSIEANVESAQIQVDHGHRSIQAAHSSQRSARKKKIVCFAVLALAILILALVIYFSVRH